MASKYLSVREFDRVSEEEQVRQLKGRLMDEFIAVKRMEANGETLEGKTGKELWRLVRDIESTHAINREEALEYGLDLLKGDEQRG